MKIAAVKNTTSNLVRGGGTKRKPPNPLKGELKKKHKIKHMGETQIQRILRIIILLRNQRLSVDQIAYKLEISRRTVYRYMDTLTGAGFVIIKEKNRYSIDINSSFFNDIGFHPVG